MRITVFTPTYNRGYIIQKLYRSLRRQSFHDFEWIVVDDGSTDDTEKLFIDFQSEENFFPIHYIKVENGGKHRAINRGVQIAQGELFYIVDSDDYLPDDALETIDQIEYTIPFENKKEFGGVCGQKGFENGSAIGQTFEGECLDITTLDRPKYKIFGDKAEVFYTHILRQYPFPEFEGENFITECVVWDKIAADGFKLRFFNKTVMICDYLADGLSAKGQELFKKNLQGSGLYLHQCILYKKINGLRKWTMYYQYYYYCRNKLPFRKIVKSLCVNPLWFRLRILGLQIFYKLYDR